MKFDVDAAEKDEKIETEKKDDESSADNKKDEKKD